jgi:hypothetical protein
LLNAEEPSDELIAALTADADSYTWIAATVGAQQAAGTQLATEEPVMPIGGFNGTDPSPTLEEFQALVADGEIHWFYGGSGFGPGRGGSDAGSDIADWVTATFTAVTIDGTTLYDLTSPTA